MSGSETVNKDKKYYSKTDSEDSTGQLESDKENGIEESQDIEIRQDSSADKDKKKKKKTARERSFMSTKWKDLHLFSDDEDKIDREKQSRNMAARKQSRARPSAGNLETRSTDVRLLYGESSTESEFEDDRVLDGRVNAADLPSEYWQIQKLVKYIKIGNQTATVIALCALSDFNLSQEMCQTAIRDVDGLIVFVNLLKTDSDKCKIGALKILQLLTKTSRYNRKVVIDSGGVQLMVGLLDTPNKELMALVASTLANMAYSSRGRNFLKRCDGIRKLVRLLDYKGNKKQTKTQEENDLDLDVARCAALGLWSCSRSKKSRSSIFKAGSVPLLAQLLKLEQEDILVPVVGLIQECAIEKNYREEIIKERMLDDIVLHLKTENRDLQVSCASAVFKCAEDEQSRTIVNKHEGLDPLVKYLSYYDDMKLVSAVSGAIWKCAISPENVEKFMQLGVVEQIMRYLVEADKRKLSDEVMMHLVGALGELAKTSNSRIEILRHGGCRTMIDMLTSANDELVANVAKTIAACAIEPECRYSFNEMDSLRLLCSLLKSSNPKVVTNAAWAVFYVMQDTPKTCETVRSFVGGLELFVNLLKSSNKEVVTAACAAISNLANDAENSAIMTDYGVIPMLAKLTRSTDHTLRRYLAEAIAKCCMWKDNAAQLSKLGAVSPLIGYLETDDIALHQSTVRALHQLARFPDCCITMHEHGVVKRLLAMVGSHDPELQESAAGCLVNIRQLALANQKAREEEIEKEAERKRARRKAEKEEEKRKAKEKLERRDNEPEEDDGDDDDEHGDQSKESDKEVEKENDLDKTNEEKEHNKNDDQRKYLSEGSDEEEKDRHPKTKTTKKKKTKRELKDKDKVKAAKKAPENKTKKKTVSVSNKTQAKKNDKDDEKGSSKEDENVVEHGDNSDN